MIRDAFLAFDDEITSQAAVVTSDALVERFGLHDQIALHLVLDNVVGTRSGTVTVALQHSADGVTWLPREANPEIDGVTVKLNETTSAYGAVDASDTRTTLPLVRAQIQLGGNVTSAYAKLYVVARDISD